VQKAVVVILNYNGKELLQEFLPQAVQYSAPYPIVVVDNASTDGSIPYLTAYCPTITCLQHTKNEGFARGYNLALHTIKAHYYILLNADVQVTPNWIEPVLQLMESNTTLAACQPKILSYLQKNAFEYAGAAGGFIDLLGYPFCRGRLFNTLELDQGQYDDSREVFWASGACIFLRAHAFWEVGGFDERLFAYYEEIDLCWRFQQHGYRIYCQGHSKVYHLGHGTFGKTNPRIAYLKFRNRALVLYKHLPTHFLGWKHHLRFVLDLLAALQACCCGNFKEAYAIVWAQVDFFKYKKHYYPPPHELSFPRQVYQRLLLWDYFIRGKKKFSVLEPLKFTGRRS
jgi:GT2 family glycosyltransferase